MRCSGPSKYLQDRFGQPHRPGCIALGVTGASKRSGIQQGDMVISLNGVPITSGRQFNERFNTEGKRLQLEVIRAGGEPFDVTLTFGAAGQIEIPKDDPLHYLEAGLSSNNGDERVRLFTQAIEMEPNFDYAYLRRGEAYYFMSKYELALADLAKTAELTPAFGEPWIWEAWVYLDLGQTDAALAAAEQAIELDGCATAFGEYNVDCYEDYNALQAIYRATGDSREAYAYHQRVKFYPRAAD